MGPTDGSGFLELLTQMGGQLPGNEAPPPPAELAGPGAGMPQIPTPQPATQPMNATEIGGKLQGRVPPANADDAISAAAQSQSNLNKSAINTLAVEYGGMLKFGSPMREALGQAAYPMAPFGTSGENPAAEANTLRGASDALTASGQTYTPGQRESENVEVQGQGGFKDVLSRIMGAGKGYGQPGALGGKPQLPTGEENARNAGDMAEGLMAGPKRAMELAQNYRPGERDPNSPVGGEALKAVFETVGTSGSVRAAAGGGRGTLGSLAGKPPAFDGDLPKLVGEMKRTQPKEFLERSLAIQQELAAEHKAVQEAIAGAKASGRDNSTGGVAVRRLATAFKPEDFGRIADEWTAMDLWYAKHVTPGKTPKTPGTAADKADDSGTELAAFGSAPKRRKVDSPDHREFVRQLAADQTLSGKEIIAQYQAKFPDTMNEQSVHNLVSQHRKALRGEETVAEKLAAKRHTERQERAAAPGRAVAENVAKLTPEQVTEMTALIRRHKGDPEMQATIRGWFGLADDTTDKLPKIAVARETGSDPRSLAAKDTLPETAPAVRPVWERQKALDGDMLEQAREMRDSGMTYSKIADELGVHPDTVAHRLKTPYTDKAHPRATSPLADPSVSELVLTMRRAGETYEGIAAHLNKEVFAGEKTVSWKAVAGHLARAAKSGRTTGGAAATTATLATGGDAEAREADMLPGPRDPVGQSRSATPTITDDTTRARRDFNTMTRDGAERLNPEDTDAVLKMTLEGYFADGDRHGFLRYLREWDRLNEEQTGHRGRFKDRTERK